MRALLYHNILKAFLFLILGMIISACQTTEDLGAEHKEITEEDSNIVFYAPGLEGGYRRIIKGYDAKERTEQITAHYGPRSGKTPYAEIYYQHLQRQGYFFKRLKIDDLVEGVLNEYREKSKTEPEIHERNFIKNPIGTVHYATFTQTDESCIMFFQAYGMNAGSHRLTGNKLIIGSYCDKGSKPFNHAEIKAILSMLGDKNKATPVNPNTYPSTQEAALKKLNTYALHLSIDWAGKQTMADVALQVNQASRIGENLKIPFKLGHKKWGACKGALLMAKSKVDQKNLEITGGWEIICKETEVHGKFSLSKEIAFQVAKETIVENFEKSNFDTMDRLVLGKGQGKSDKQEKINITISSKNKDVLQKLNSLIEEEKKSREANQSTWLNTEDPLVRKKLSANWQVDINWYKLSRIRDVPLKLRLDGNDLIGTFSFNKPPFGTCLGSGEISNYIQNHREESLVGNWEVTCDKLSAEGDITVGPAGGFGTGADQEGRSVIVLLSAS